MTALGILVGLIIVGALAAMCCGCYCWGLDVGKSAGLFEATNSIQAIVSARSNRRYEPQSVMAIAPAFEYPEPESPEPITAAAGVEGDWPRDF